MLAQKETSINIQLFIIFQRFSCRSGPKWYEDIVRVSGRHVGFDVSSWIRHQGHACKLWQILRWHLQWAWYHWLECQLYGSQESQNSTRQVNRRVKTDKSLTRHMQQLIMIEMFDTSNDGDFVFPAYEINVSIIINGGSKHFSHQSIATCEDKTHVAIDW